MALYSAIVSSPARESAAIRISSAYGRRGSRMRCDPRRWVCGQQAYGERHASGIMPPDDTPCGDRRQQGPTKELALSLPKRPPDATCACSPTAECVPGFLIRLEPHMPGAQQRINAPHVVHETIDGETILIHLGTGAYYSLEGVGAHVWGLAVAGGEDGRDRCQRAVALRRGSAGGRRGRSDRFCEAARGGAARALRGRERWSRGVRQRWWGVALSGGPGG